VKLPISAAQIKPHSEHETINTKQNNKKKKTPQTKDKRKEEVPP